MFRCCRRFFVTDLPDVAPADEHLGRLPAVGAGVNDGDVSPTAPLPVGIPGALGPAALLCLGDPVVFLAGASRRSRGWLVVGFRAGPGLLEEGFERRGVRDGGRDCEDVGDHGSDLQLRLGLRGIARARVWPRGVALRRRRLLLLLGLSDLGKRWHLDGGRVEVLIGGRRQWRKLEQRRLGAPASIEEVVDLKVGREGKTLFRVQPVQP
jgi:hypothetical protein